MKKSIKVKIIFMVVVLILTSISFGIISNGSTNVNATPIIVESGSSNYKETVGTWNNSSSVTGYDGTSVRRSSNDCAAVMWWLPEGNSAGYYTISVYKVVSSDGDPNTTIGIMHEYGAESIKQDWTTGTSGWVELGTFYMSPGNSRTVVSLVRGMSYAGTGTAIADAVKFVSATDYTPTPQPTIPTLPPTSPEYLPSGYTLQFFDDFNGTSLDTSIWDYWEGTSSRSAYNPENVTVSGGNCNIAIKKEAFGGKNYTVGGIVSKPSFNLGYFEARIKLTDTGSGFHQSVWLYTNLGQRMFMGPNAFEEIDILESDSSNTTHYSTNVHNWGWLSGIHTSTGGSTVTAPDLSAGYHIVGVEYTDTQAKFYFDGVLQNIKDTSSIIKHKTSFLINACEYETINDTNLPGTYSIDWVKYYAPPVSTPPTPGTYLINDDFEDGDSAGWTPVNGDWSVVTDGATKVYKQSAAATSGRSYIGNSSWTDYTVTAKIKLNDTKTGAASGVMLRYQDDNNYYMFRLHQSGYAQLYKVIGGVATLLTQTAQSVSTGTWYTLAADVSGDTFNCWIDGVQKVTNITDSSLSNGYPGVTSYQQSYSVDDMAIYTSDSAPVTLFSDDFEDGDSVGWTPVNGDWSVVTDGATKVYKQSAAATSGRSYVGNSSWTDYTVTAKIKLNDTKTSAASGVMLRYQDDNNYYMFRLHQSGYAQLYKVVGGVATLLTQTAQSVSTGTWYTLAADVSGDTFNCWVDGVQKVTNVTDSSLSNGYPGVTSYQQSYSVDDMSVYVTGGI